MTDGRTEPLDAFTAVFNRHINNADQRARDVMSDKCPGYLAKVLKREREGNGIMAIFDPPTSKAFKRYASLVQIYVNGSKP